MSPYQDVGFRWLTRLYQVNEQYGVWAALCADLMTDECMFKQQSRMAKCALHF